MATPTRRTAVLLFVTLAIAPLNALAQSATVRASERRYRSFGHNGLFMPYKRIDSQWLAGGASDGTRLRVLGFALIGVEAFANCVPSDHVGTKVRYQWY